VSKERKISIGLLHTYNADLRPYELLLSQYGLVKLIQYDERRLIDMLIIPHGIGVDQSLPNFKHGNYVNYPYGSICPKAQVFFKNEFDWYRSNRNIPIIGFGDGACYMWSQLGESYKLVTNSTGINMLQTGSEIKGLSVEVNDINLVEYFVYKPVFGVSDDWNLFQKQVRDRAINLHTLINKLKLEDEEDAKKLKNNNTADGDQFI
jgi:hypothetical protein